MYKYGRRMGEFVKFLFEFPDFVLFLFPSFLFQSFFSSSTKACSLWKTNNAVCCTHINTFIGGVGVQGYNVALGICQLTGTFTLVSVCVANFSIWLTETHTLMVLQKALWIIWCGCYDSSQKSELNSCTK